MICATDQHNQPSSSLSVRRIWGLLLPLLRPYYPQLLLGVALMLASRASSLVLPYASKIIVDDVVVKRDSHLLLLLTIIIIIAVIIEAIGTSIEFRLISYTACEIVTDLRKKLQEHIGRLSLDYHDSKRDGELLSRIMTDTDGVRDLIGPGLVDFVGGLTTAVFALILLFRINVLLTGITFVFLILLVRSLKSSMDAIHPVAHRQDSIYAEVSGRLVESLAGVRVVKVYAAEAKETAAFAAGAMELLANRREWFATIARMNFSMTTLTGVATALVAFIGAHEVFVGKLTLGELVTFIAFLTFLVAPISQMVSVMPNFTAGVAGLERTMDVLRECPEDRERHRRIIMPSIKGTVTYDQVVFSYKAGPTVLQGIDFNAEPGTLTALVGPSGAGKSTIVSLLAAFYSPLGGAIRVDGIDLSQVNLQSYRSQLGIVLQDTFLFAGTIEENVAFAKPRSTETEIMAACKVARVDEFAEKLKDGYKTIVGERGVFLSGGQCQRMSIARAVLVNPRILILDEATSNIDSESEVLIAESLQDLMTGRTTLVIAHRLSTIRRADQILFIEQGRIVERGTHESLMSLGRRYRDLFTRQHSEGRNLL